MQRIQVIDSHTGGEPTRLVIGGFPDLGGGSAEAGIGRKARIGVDLEDPELAGAGVVPGAAAAVSLFPVALVSPLFPQAAMSMAADRTTTNFLLIVFLIWCICAPSRASF